MSFLSPTERPAASKFPIGTGFPPTAQGLSLCDATSAIFAMEIDWTKIDVSTFSWQKCLGGEAAHGMLVLSPRAVARLESYDPPWPMPKIFRMKKSGKINRAIFEGEVNQHHFHALRGRLSGRSAWAGNIGLAGLIKKSKANLKIVEDWVAKTPWVDFLAQIKTSVPILPSV